MYVKTERADLKAETVRGLFHYDPETGVLVCKVDRRPTKAGDVAGYKTPNGYLVVFVCGYLYKAHRLAWFIHHGEWPSGPIDHINGIRTDNRLSNLRATTNFVNNQNRAINRRNQVGFSGVIARHGKFVANIKAFKKRHFLGSFETPEQAHAAYVEAKKNLHTFSPEIRLVSNHRV